VRSFGRTITFEPVDFEQYLTAKKIDSIAFKHAEPARWSDWQAEFSQLHPDSFTAQKLYLINPIRRKYPIKEPNTQSHV
jgi:hypothetical protein